jgi:hypothetical protein
MRPFSGFNSGDNVLSGEGVYESLSDDLSVSQLCGRMRDGAHFGHRIAMPLFEHIR